MDDLSVSEYYKLPKITLKNILFNRMVDNGGIGYTALSPDLKLEYEYHIYSYGYGGRTWT